MKGRTLTLLGVLAGLVAAALIIARNHITPAGVVLTGGILFILAGICNAIVVSRNRTSSISRSFGYTANAASIVLGICMIAFVESFVPLVSFIFGVLVALFSIWQFYVLASGIKPYRLAAWLYVFPIALLGIAAYIIFGKASLEAFPIILSTGIAVAVLALGCLVEGGMLGAARHLTSKTKTADKQDEAATSEEHHEAAKPEEHEAEAAERESAKPEAKEAEKTTAE